MSAFGSDEIYSGTPRELWETYIGFAAQFGTVHDDTADGIWVSQGGQVSSSASPAQN